MEISIFAKKRTTQDNRTFPIYLTRLTKKDGSELTASVKFNEEMCRKPDPAKCPMNIIVNKSDANLSHKTFTNHETGEITMQYTLWVSAYGPGSEFVDHSLDEFED